MPCLFALFSVMFPRLGVLFIWLARPAYFNSVFGGSWILPLLGVIFLPFTTLMTILLWSPGVGLYGFDWFWIAMSVMIDLMHAGTSAYQNRDKLPLSNSAPPPAPAK
jgi:hypothetical protein